MAVAFKAEAPPDPRVRMLYSFAEAAAWLKVSPRQVRILVDEKRLRGVHIGRLHRIAHDDLVAYVTALRSRD